MTKENLFLTIPEASDFASFLTGRNVSTANISYLLQYGRIKKIGNNGSTKVLKEDLIQYYLPSQGKKEQVWKKELGEDLNWSLSFESLTEKERTKHVHRLHPYKGKFIPQLVEYFIDDHTDRFKSEVYFHPGDILLDPFCGSGTTLVQANELGIHAIGIDISSFNAMISNVKIEKHDISQLSKEVSRITIALKEYISGKKYIQFDNELTELLTQYNNVFFPSPDYKYQIRQGTINEEVFGKTKEIEFLNIFNDLVKKYDLSIRQTKNETFLDLWYVDPVRTEIEFVNDLIHNVQDNDTKKVLAVILSRTIRSCRATTHADLATLVEPVHKPYYCKKHGKICKPIFSIMNWWERYSKDTIKRLSDFNGIRTDTYQYCFSGDSRSIDLNSKSEQWNPSFYRLLGEKKFNGIFSSPPYVGLIDYHEQHAYAYDLFNFPRKDQLEIGPLYKGQGKDARDVYVNDISNVLINCRKFLADDYNIFLVANDKYGIYPRIVEKAKMRIVEIFKRPVLYRTEKNKTPYSEMIFHIRESL